MSRIIAGIATTLFAGELLIMEVLLHLPQLSPLTQSLVDGLLLAAFTIPVVFFLVVRPLQGRIRSHVGELNAMLAQREWLAHVFDSVDESISVTDARGCVEHVNPSFTRLMGYSLDELRGQPFAILQSGEHNRAYYAELWGRLKTHGTWQGRIVDKTKAGELIELYLTISPLRDAVGRTGGYVAIHRDLRSLLEHERQLRTALEEQQRISVELDQAREQAVTASAAKSRFLATMSHEIRTPLAGVLGTLELLATSELNPGQKEYATLSLRSAKALLAVLNDVLDFSKIEAQGVALANAPFDARQAACDVAELFAAQAMRQGLELRAVGLTEPVWVQGDVLRVNQVLSNLVGNAIKFTQKGFVRLSADVTEAAAHRVLRFTVEDTGIGIAAEHQAALFAPFVQAEASTQRRFGGTGLGLTISRRLAEAMGGSITFESVEGQGTRFCFSVQLPAAEPGSPSSSTSLSASERQAVQGLRVLVAEDNPVNQLVLSRLLARHACLASLVENGASALECLSSAEFDVVLMDMQMPVLDGLGATRAIRAAGQRWSGLPVVALTANAFQEDREACSAAGMTGFLPKPVNEVLLVRTLLRLTGRSPQQG